jgi:hypothetical protein
LGLLLELLKYLRDVPFSPHVAGLQLVGKIEREKEFKSGVQSVSAACWLSEIDLGTFGGN